MLTDPRTHVRIKRLYEDAMRLKMDVEGCRLVLSLYAKNVWRHRADGTPVPAHYTDTAVRAATTAASLLREQLATEARMTQLLTTPRP